MDDDDPIERVALFGGVTNAGAVFRVGNEVHRPHRVHIEALDLVARHVATHQIEAPFYLGRDDVGNDRLAFIDGDVPVRPFPAWSLTVDSLTSAARLLRRFHNATRSMVQPKGVRWDRAMADPNGGPVIGHNDACPDNTVFRNGHAVGFIDYDLVAPTDPLLDFAHFARMWVPLGVPIDSATRLAVLTDRIRAALRGYGIASSDALAAAFDFSFDQGESFVREHPSPFFDSFPPRYFETRRKELSTALQRWESVR